MPLQGQNGMLKLDRSCTRGIRLIIHERSSKPDARIIPGKASKCESTCGCFILMELAGEFTDQFAKGVQAFGLLLDEAIVF